MANFLKVLTGPRKPTINVVRMTGVIQAANSPRHQLINFERFNKPLERAFRAHNVKAVALEINSRGGSATQSNLIWKRVRQLKKETGVPVVAFLEDVAASGGYYLACSADKIVADENSMIGSIGVIFASFGAKEAISKLGLERRVYTAGESKAMLDPFSDEKKEDVEKINELLLHCHENFISVVEKSRGERLQDPTGNELYSGRIWSAKKALEVGLIDHIADRHSFCYEHFGEGIQFRYFNPRGMGMLDFPFGAKAGVSIEEIIGHRLPSLISS